MNPLLDDLQARKRAQETADRLEPGWMASRLPAVEAPRFEDIVVPLVKPPPPGAEQIRAYHLRRTRPHRTHRRLHIGEVIREGDCVQINALGAINGQLQPDVIWAESWVDLDALGSAVFLQHVPGMALGSWREFTLESGSRVMVMRIQVIAARRYEVTSEDELLFAKLTESGECEGALAESREELQHLQARASAAITDNLILDELSDRVTTAIPQDLIETALDEEWRRTNGAALETLRIPIAWQLAAAEAWKANPQPRRRAERSLKIASIFRAISEKERVTVSKDAIASLLREQADALDAPLKPPPEEAFILKKDGDRFLQDCWYLTMLSHVRKRVRIVPT